MHEEKSSPQPKCGVQKEQKQNFYAAMQKRYGRIKLSNQSPCVEMIVILPCLFKCSNLLRTKSKSSHLGCHLSQCTASVKKETHEMMADEQHTGVCDRCSHTLQVSPGQADSAALLLLSRLSSSQHIYNSNNFASIKLNSFKS